MARPAASRSRAPAPGDARDLPGEHGFRFFPGFYHHVPDSMGRTPYKGKPNGVKDNLAAADEAKFSAAATAPTRALRLGPDPQAC